MGQNEYAAVQEWEKKASWYNGQIRGEVVTMMELGNSDDFGTGPVLRYKYNTGDSISGLDEQALRNCDMLRFDSIWTLNSYL